MMDFYRCLLEWPGLGPLGGELGNESATWHDAEMTQTATPDGGLPPCDMP